MSFKQKVSIFDTDFKMIFVEGGEFEFENAWDKVEPLKKVSVKSFYIAETMISRKLYTKIMKNMFIYEVEDYKNQPQNMNYSQAKQFIKRLNMFLNYEYKDSKIVFNFRLPTMHEWQYASKGGKHSEGFIYSGSNSLDEVGWYNKNSEGKYRPMKLKNPNELGIYDMSGNMNEWCSDTMCISYSEYCSIFGFLNLEESPEDLENARKNYKVICGGDIHARAKYTQSNHIDFMFKKKSTDIVGLRLAHSI